MSQKYCIFCGKPLTGHQRKYCDKTCQYYYNKDVLDKYPKDYVGNLENLVEANKGTKEYIKELEEKIREDELQIENLQKEIDSLLPKCEKVLAEAHMEPVMDIKFYCGFCGAKIRNIEEDNFCSSCGNEIDKRIIEMANQEALRQLTFGRNLK